MSAEEPLTGKAKKSKRSEERFQRGKKRKRGSTEGEPALLTGEESTAQQDQFDLADQEQGTEKGFKGASEDQDDSNSSARRKKKRRIPEQAKTDHQDHEGPDDTTTTAQPSKHRYIVFIGNLPYSTTTAALETHFKSITPSSIRHRTDPQTKKSKGFAFLEFASYDRMKTCLKLYHHSMFDSGKAGEKKRRINVELTAGGGGKGEQRKKKLGEKNERLEEQRKRRAEAMAKQEGSKKTKRKGSGGEGYDAWTDAQEVGPSQADDDGMHPARLARLQGAS